MLQIFKSVDDTLTTLEAPEKGCWVHMTAPTQEEVASVAASLQLEADFLNAALDEEESPVSRWRTARPWFWWISLW